MEDIKESKKFKDFMELECGNCLLKNKCSIGTEECYTRKQRWRAVMLAYILPFVVLAGVIIVISRLTENEYIIGGSALATVAIYYLIMYLIQPKI